MIEIIFTINEKGRITKTVSVFAKYVPRAGEKVSIRKEGFPAANGIVESVEHWFGAITNVYIDLKV